MYFVTVQISLTYTLPYGYDDTNIKLRILSGQGENKHLLIFKLWIFEQRYI